MKHYLTSAFLFAISSFDLFAAYYFFKAYPDSLYWPLALAVFMFISSQANCSMKKAHDH